MQQYGREAPIDDPPGDEGHLPATTLPSLQSRRLSGVDSLYKTLIVAYATLVLEFVILFRGKTQVVNKKKRMALTKTICVF